MNLILSYALVVIAGLWTGVSCNEEMETKIFKIANKPYDALDVVKKTPSQLLRMRGFQAEVHYAHTKDGYYIHLVHVRNPMINFEQLKRPVIFNHGLIESSTIWLINSHNVKPQPLNDLCEGSVLNRTEDFINGPMMLANHGYDVWLMSMRGTDWSLRHDKLTYKDRQFWNYCLDDFALVDVPTVIDYVRNKTGAARVGYIGHSQATFSIFGLLATRPRYADIVEPVIAVAPVSYFDHITSIARTLFMATLTATDKDTHGPFPKSAKRMRNILTDFCSKDSKDRSHSACNLIEIVGGNGKNWPKGFYSHIPFFTSLKILRHFGQLIQNKRYMMYDYGMEENIRLYGTARSPSYPIGKISSKSLCLFWTKSDSISHPKDVERFKRQLKVPLFRDVFIDKDFNHFDLITDKLAGELVFKPILEILETFEHTTGICAEPLRSPFAESDPASDEEVELVEEARTQ